jgi:hypothetical protein
MSLKAINKDSKGDEYYTPAYIVEILLPYIKERGYQTIWCPFDKEWSEYVKVFKKEGLTVIHSHVDDGHNFLEIEAPRQYDIIISNPPFSIKQEIFDKLVKLNKPFAILLSATSIQGAKFMQTLSKIKELNFIMFDKRISYSGDRPSFPSWYFTSKLLNSNQFYIYKEDPKKLYNEWQESLKQSHK